MKNTFWLALFSVLIAGAARASCRVFIELSATARPVPLEYRDEARIKAKIKPQIERVFLDRSARNFNDGQHWSADLNHYVSYRDLRAFQNSAGQEIFILSSLSDARVPLEVPYVITPQSELVFRDDGPYIFFARLDSHAIDREKLANNFGIHLRENNVA